MARGALAEVLEKREEAQCELAELYGCEPEEDRAAAARCSAWRPCGWAEPGPPRAGVWQADGAGLAELEVQVGAMELLERAAEEILAAVLVEMEMQVRVALVVVMELLVGERWFVQQ